MSLRSALRFDPMLNGGAAQEIECLRFLYGLRPGFGEHRCDDRIAFLCQCDGQNGQWRLQLPRDRKQPRATPLFRLRPDDPTPALCNPDRSVPGRRRVRSHRHRKHLSRIGRTRSSPAGRDAPHGRSDRLHSRRLGWYPTGRSEKAIFPQTMQGSGSSRQLGHKCWRRQIPARRPRGRQKLARPTETMVHANFIGAPGKSRLGLVRNRAGVASQFENVHAGPRSRCR